MNAQDWDPLKVPKVASDQLKPMVDRRSSDLQVGIFENLTSACQLRIDLTINPSDSLIVG
jgi:hypothetical protein